MNIGNTPAQAIAWAKSSAARTHDGGTWDGWCESAVSRAVGAHGGFEYASDQGDAAKIISTAPGNAPAGAIHHWRHVPALIGGGHGRPGHTSVNLSRGRYSLMASTWASSHPHTLFHTNLGTVDTAAYSRAHPGMVYEGWSIDFGGLYVMKGLVVVVKVPGNPALWRINPNLTRHHLTPAQWKPLKAAGTIVNNITATRLRQFAIA